MTPTACYLILGAGYLLACLGCVGLALHYLSH